jgi:hypothetical protein
MSATTVNFTGAETGDTSELSTSAGTFSVQTSVVHTGKYAFRCNPTTTGTGYFSFGLIGNNGVLTAFQAPSLNNVGYWVRFYFQYLTKPAAVDEIIFTTITVLKGLPPGFQIRLDLNGHLRAYNHANTLMATGTTVLSSGTWYRIECKFGSGLNTAWEIKINGVSEISGTDTTTESVGDVVFGKYVNKNGNTVDFYYDDCNIDSAAYPGPGFTLVSVPTGAGFYTAWSGSYTNLTEIPFDTSTYVTNSTINNAATYTMQSTGTIGASGTVNAVKNFIACENSVVASAGSVKSRLRSSTTDSDTTTALGMNPAFQTIQKLFVTDPATGSAWTLGGVDGAQVGVLCTAAPSSGQLRMTCSYMLMETTVTGFSTSGEGTIGAAASVVASSIKAASATVHAVATEIASSLEHSTASAGAAATVTVPSNLMPSASGGIGAVATVVATQPQPPQQPGLQVVVLATRRKRGKDELTEEGRRRQQTINEAEAAAVRRKQELEMWGSILAEEDDLP